MKLEQLNEAKYDHGNTIERVIRFFNAGKMTYGPGGEEQPAYTIKPEFVALLKDTWYVDDFILGQNHEGKFVYVNNSESYVLDWFLESIKIYRKDREL